MARPREFDITKALHKAKKVFWLKGFAATSTEDLLEAMGIKRQSLYNAFGDKMQLYRESLAVYLDDVTAAHIARLTEPTSALEGVRDLLLGLIPDDERLRHLGCMGVCSVGEFGDSDRSLSALRNKSAVLLSASLLARIKEGQAKGEIDPDMKPEEVLGFIQTNMNGIQVAARAGGNPAELKKIAGFAVDRLSPV